MDEQTCLLITVNTSSDRRYEMTVKLVSSYGYFSEEICKCIFNKGHKLDYYDSDPEEKIIAKETCPFLFSKYRSMKKLAIHYFDFYMKN